MSETEFDENGQWTGTCCQCLTSHDGHPPGTLGGEVRCLIAQAEELGNPELVNKAQDVLHHAAERRDDALVRAWNLEHPEQTPMSGDVDRDLQRRELEAIVHDLGAIDEPDVIDDRGVRMCGLCGGGPGEDEWEKPQDDAHYDNCPWRRARELMSTQPDQGDDDAE